MAKGIVDRLELVDVEKQHRHPRLRARGVGHRLIEAVAQQKAIGETGKRIVVGQELDVLLGTLAVAAFEHLGGKPQLLLGTGAHRYLLLQLAVGPPQLLGAVAKRMH